MLAKVTSGAVVGLTAVPITVEVDIAAQGLPSFTIVGLPDKAVEESRDRVRAAIKNSGADLPAKRIIVNLAPADLPKIGPAYDVPRSADLASSLNFHGWKFLSHDTPLVSTFAQPYLSSANA